MKARIIETSTETRWEHLKPMCEMKMVGYQDGVLITLTIKAPANHFEDLPDLLQKELDVSVTFDEYVSTLKTTKLI